MKTLNQRLNHKPQKRSNGPVDHRPPGTEPGSVMVFDDDGDLLQCREEYDKKVAGVISGAGKYKPGILMDHSGRSGKKFPVALTGKVMVKADARFGAISVGDWLTTSTTLGHARRADDGYRSFGSVIGKALSTLSTGQGMVAMAVVLH